MDYNAKSLEICSENLGKLSVVTTVPVTDRDELSSAYTPGVAEPCRKIHANPEDVYKYTIKSRTVAVVSDGTAVLGLGNIGPKAALPVMEGKSVLFKEFGGIDAFPICLDTKDTEEIIRTVKIIAPAFGGINLEDISAPRCFEIEQRLRKELDIPVFHDDQHGTAIVVSAGLTNALKRVGKQWNDARIVINGAGSAGISICRLLMQFKPADIIMADKKGLLCPGEEWMNPVQAEFAQKTNKSRKNGVLKDALAGADVFIGVSGPNVLKKEDIALMNKDAIIFAMANPTPEIMPEEAISGGARIVASGRSDYPNQINNVLVFPGIFKGALSVRASDITDNMKLAAARAIAGIIPENELRDDYIIPGVFDKRVAESVANAVAAAAGEDGVAKIKINNNL